MEKREVGFWLGGEDFGFGFSLSEGSSLLLGSFDKGTAELISQQLLTEMVKSK